MKDNTQENLEEKLKRSLLPIEFNRKKELFKMLTERKMNAHEQCQKIMKEIIEKKNRGEDITE